MSSQSVPPRGPSRGTQLSPPAGRPVFLSLPHFMVFPLSRYVLFSSNSLLRTGPPLTRCRPPSIRNERSACSILPVSCTAFVLHFQCIRRRQILNSRKKNKSKKVLATSEKCFYQSGVMKKVGHSAHCSLHRDERALSSLGRLISETAR